MHIQILHTKAEADKAKGLVVVIDVFRAFSLESYMYATGAKKVIPVGSVKDSFALKEKNPEYILVGERNGIKVEGFDYGNSPAIFVGKDLTGKTLIHTTSAGVQGLVAVKEKADCILTGALTNAKAIATYVKKKNPEQVTLLAMGWNGVKDTEEDVLCAEYIRSLLEEKPLADVKERALLLKEQEGKKFFDPSQKEVFPEEDFWLCTKIDIFDHVIEVVPCENGFEEHWVMA